MPRHNKYSFTLENFRQAIRRGPYCWHVGYDRCFITSDGAALCFKCAEQERTSVLWSIANEFSDGWRIVASCSTDTVEDAEECSHCNAFLNDYYNELTPQILPAHWAHPFEYGADEGFPSSDTDPHEAEEKAAFLAYVERMDAQGLTYETHDRNGGSWFQWYNDSSSEKCGTDCNRFWFAPKRNAL